MAMASALALGSSSESVKDALAGETTPNGTGSEEVNQFAEKTP